MCVMVVPGDDKQLRTLHAPAGAVAGLSPSRGRDIPEMGDDEQTPVFLASVE